MRHLLSLLTLACLTLPASAASTKYEAPVPLGPDSMQPPGVDTPHASWAGYIATGSAFTAITASWVQPVVDCAIVKGGRASFWVGLGDANTIQQDGTFAKCDNGTPTYTAWWEMFDRQGGGAGHMAFAVAPGDVIEASVFFVAGKFALTVTDETSGQSFTDREPCATACDRTNAEWIVERPGGGTYPLANYGSIIVTGATAATANDSGPAGIYPHVAMVAKLGGAVLDSASDLTAGGSSFTVSWASAGSGKTK